MKALSKIQHILLAMFFTVRLVVAGSILSYFMERAKVEHSLHTLKNVWVIYFYNTRMYPKLQTKATVSWKFEWTSKDIFDDKIQDFVNSVLVIGPNRSCSIFDLKKVLTNFINSKLNKILGRINQMLN